MQGRAGTGKTVTLALKAIVHEFQYYAYAAQRIVDTASVGTTTSVVSKPSTSSPQQGERAALRRAANEDQGRRQFAAASTHTRFTSFGLPPLTFLVTQSKTLTEKIRTEEFHNRRAKLLHYFGEQKEEGATRITKKRRVQALMAKLARDDHFGTGDSAVAPAGTAGTGTGAFLSKGDFPVSEDGDDSNQSQSEVSSSSVASLSLPRNLDQIGPRAATHAATFAQFMQILDASIGDAEYFFQQNRSLAGGQTVHLYLADRLQLAVAPPAPASRKRPVQPDSAQRRLSSEDEVTYEKFKNVLWPKYLKPTTQYKSDYVAYREILIIKAGRRAASSTSGAVSLFQHLTRKEYVEDVRASPEIQVKDSSERAQIYDLFEHYQQHLFKNPALWDMADCVNHVYRRWLRKKTANDVRRGGTGWGFHGRPITSLNVDETQDLLSRQVRAFTAVARDAAAYNLSADTAQAIAFGRSFSWSAVKAEILTDTVLHELKERAKREDVAKLCAEVRKASMMEDDCESSTYFNRQVRHLTHSFRTHEGILKFASAFTFPLTRLFAGRDAEAMGALVKVREQNPRVKYYHSRNHLPLSRYHDDLRYLGHARSRVCCGRLSYNQHQGHCPHAVLHFSILEETASRDGEAPLLLVGDDASPYGPLTGWDLVNVLRSLERGETTSSTNHGGQPLGAGSVEASGSGERGAERRRFLLDVDSQMVVVPNESERTAALEVFEPESAVFTVQEAKGLERAHVLLWNCLSGDIIGEGADEDFARQWEELPKMVQTELHRLSSGRLGTHNPEVPFGDRVRPNAVELFQIHLKKIYTAVARPKKTLLLFESVLSPAVDAVIRFAHGFVELADLHDGLPPATASMGSIMDEGAGSSSSNALSKWSITSETPLLRVFRFGGERFARVFGEGRTREDALTLVATTVQAVGVWSGFAHEDRQELPEGQGPCASTTAGPPLPGLQQGVVDVSGAAGADKTPLAILRKALGLSLDDHVPLAEVPEERFAAGLFALRLRAAILYSVNQPAADLHAGQLLRSLHLLEVARAPAAAKAEQTLQSATEALDGFSVVPASRKTDVFSATRERRLLELIDSYDLSVLSGGGAFWEDTSIVEARLVQPRFTSSDLLKSTGLQLELVDPNPREKTSTEDSRTTICSTSAWKMSTNVWKGRPGGGTARPCRLRATDPLPLLVAALECRVEAAGSVLTAASSSEMEAWRERLQRISFEIALDSFAEFVARLESSRGANNMKLLLAVAERLLWILQNRSVVEPRRGAEEKDNARRPATIEERVQLLRDAMAAVGSSVSVASAVSTNDDEVNFPEVYGTESAEQFSVVQARVARLLNMVEQEQI